MRRLVLSFLAALVAFAGATAALAESRAHVDRKAGIRFDIPFHNARVLRGEQIEAAVRRQLGDRYPEDIHYTSGVYSEGSIPYVIVWTKKADGGVSRQLVDLLSGSSATRAQAALGFRAFAFNREALRGEGILPEQGGLKVRVLLQLVKDRYTYVGYYYKTAAQLREFDVIKKSLHVGRLSKLDYRSLPVHSTGGALSWIAGLLAAAALGGLVTFGAYYAYRHMGQDPVLAAAQAQMPRSDEMPGQLWRSSEPTVVASAHPDGVLAGHAVLAGAAAQYREPEI